MESTYCCVGMCRCVCVCVYVYVYMPTQLHVYSPEGMHQGVLATI